MVLKQYKKYLNPFKKKPSQIEKQYKLNKINKVTSIGNSGKASE